MRRRQHDNITTDTRYTHAQGPRAHGVVVFSLMRAVLNFTDGVSGVNHSLAGGELSLLLYLAVSSALYVLPSV